MLGTLFTLPDASTMLTSMGSTSAILVADFLPVIYLIGGIFIMSALVWLIITGVGHAVHAIRGTRQ